MNTRKVIDPTHLAERLAARLDRMTPEEKKQSLIDAGILTPKGNLSAHCYHAQQCVEKCLKACCIHLNILFPYTHDLSALLDVLFSQGDLNCPDWADEAKELTTYVTTGRYPGLDDPVTEEEWKEAVRIAKNRS